jgi:glycosyltransferase involved in cell wall biosynthesis
MGVRDRPDSRLVNALRSIRAQQYPAGSVRVIVVDYGSAPANGAAIARIAEEHRAEYVAVEHAPVWSRSRSLNVGIRQADSKFLLTSDADIVLSPRYLSDAVAALTTSPLSILCSPMFDLPEASVATLARAAETGDLRVEAWKENAKPRHDWQFHPSICMAYTKVFKLIRGYDDDDLMRRLTYLGLAQKTLDTGSFYLHQWHPKFEGVPEAGSAAQIQRNLVYLEEHHSIVRNDRDWGMPRA